jgi:hypothetical protein
MLKVASLRATYPLPYTH